METFWTCVLIMVLAYLQNIFFTLVSRSRNRNNTTYHLIASVGSNGVWYMTFRELVVSQMDLILFVPYTIGTVSGSITGAKVAMWIEKRIGAVSDDHLKK